MAKEENIKFLMAKPGLDGHDTGVGDKEVQEM